MSERPDMEGPWTDSPDWWGEYRVQIPPNRWDHLVPPKKEQTMTTYPSREELHRALCLLEQLTSEIDVVRAEDIDPSGLAPLDCHYLTCTLLKDSDRPCRMYEDFLVPLMEQWSSELRHISAMAVQPMPAGPDQPFLCVNLCGSHIPLRFTMAYDVARRSVVVMTDFMCRQLGSRHPNPRWEKT